MALIADLGTLHTGKTVHVESAVTGWWKFRVPKGSEKLTIKAFGKGGGLTTLGVNVSFGFPDADTPDTAINPLDTGGAAAITQTDGIAVIDVSGYDSPEMVLYLDIYSLTLGAATAAQFWMVVD